MGRWDYFYPRYKPAKPKQVADGIKLQSDKIGATWWSKKWLSALESFGWSARLQRGRKYARSGQVVDFAINPGQVTARVQGTRPKPYSVKIELKLISAADWEKVISVMGSQAIFAAKLLTGEMPQNIEEAFAAANVSLLPNSAKDLKTECSCPDWANPCKHIAALYYILADEFDRDPFMIFHLRGRRKEQIIDELRKIRSLGKPEAEGRSGAFVSESSKVEPLEDALDKFWHIGEGFEAFNVSINPATVSIAILKLLGPPAFWGGKPDFFNDMEHIYKLIGDKAIKTAYSGGEGNGENLGPQQSP